MKAKTPKRPKIQPGLKTAPASKKPKAPPRVAQGDRVRATVAGWTLDGVALATTAHGPTHVVGGVPGDVGDVRILGKGQHQMWGVIDPTVLEVTSEDRVEPPCAVVLRCGGCPWQMVSTEHQRQTRRESLATRLGDAAAKATWHPLLEAPEPFGFRTRATMIVRHQGGRLRAGFYEPRSQTLVPAEECSVQHPLVNRTAKFALKEFVSANLPSWRGEERPGLLRALVIRVDPDRDKALLSMVVSQDDPRLPEIGAALLRIDGVVGVSAIINNRPSGPLAAGEVIQLGGATHLVLRAGEYKVPVGPLAFTQTHVGAARKMVYAVAGMLPEEDGEHLVDLYAGVGVFGLALADRAKRVTLVERNPEAAAAARAAVGESSKVTVVEGDAAKVVADVIGDGVATTVILDPPRAGCRPEVLAAIAESAVETVIYVSCGPKALVRDIARLPGFEMTEIFEVEMFPHSPHEEVIVKLVRTPTP
ncbi:MAG: 23S rRNA (uracil1939-C5)-methyltransferase [Myxococcota bacterium]